MFEELSERVLGKSFLCAKPSPVLFLCFLCRRIWNLKKANLLILKFKNFNVRLIIEKVTNLDSLQP